MPAYHFAVSGIGSALTLTGTVVATSPARAVEAFKDLLPSRVNLTPAADAGDDWANIAMDAAMLGEHHIVRIDDLPHE